MGVLSCGMVGAVSVGDFRQERARDMREGVEINTSNAYRTDKYSDYSKQIAQG